MAKKNKGEASLIKTLNDFTGALRKVYGDINNISNTWAKVDQASANFARSVGMAAEGMHQLRKSTIDLVAANKLAINFGVNAEKLIQLQNQYTQAIGRNVKANNEGLTNFAAMTRLLQDQGAVDMITKLENFGVSMEEAGNRVGKMFADASKKGISFETYSKNFLNNIEIAQNYTFAEGLRGLENMAKKASQIKLDMQQTASFANKVNTVEGAINVGAKLQVLGGTFSQFADPLSMLGESLNDMDALQDRLIKMMGNLGQFNKMTGEVEISAFNKQRIAAASEAMGVSSSEMMKMINSKARRNEIENQLNIRTDLNKDVKEMILNMGTIEKGVAGVNIDGEFKELSKISNKDQQTLIKQNQTQTEDIKEIARTLRGWDDMRQGRIEQYKNAEAGTIGSITGRITKWADSFIGDLGKILGYGAIISGIGTLGKGGLGILSSLKKEKGGLLEGPSHKQGGMPIVGSNIEVEGGEFIVNKKATKKNLPLLNAINRDKYEDGGILGSKIEVEGGEFIVNKKATKKNLQLLKDTNRDKYEDGGILGSKISDNDDSLMKLYVAQQLIDKFKGFDLRQYDRHLMRRYDRMKAFKTQQVWDKLLKPLNENFAEKTFGKIDKLGKLGKVSASSLKLGGITSLLSLGTSALSIMETRQKLQSGELEKGSKEQRMESNSNARQLGSGIGSAVGTLFGPLGTIVGGLLGAGVGWGISAIGNQKNKKIKTSKDALSLAGINLKGDYNKKELEEIKSAVRGDNDISHLDFMTFTRGLRDKMLKYGDYSHPTIKKQKGGLLNGLSHNQGGMPIMGSNIEVEGGEFIVNKNATKKNLGILNKINNNEVIKPRLDEKQKPLNVTPTTPVHKQNDKETIDINPIKLDISGTLKLDVPSTGQSIDLKGLINNPVFINTLTNLIEKQMVINQRGGNIVSRGLNV